MRSVTAADCGETAVMNDNMHAGDGRAGDHTPTALYFEDSDSIEYVRRDAPSVYRRVDALLTLIVDMDSRDPLGFQLKGFKHYYNKNIRSSGREADFVRVINVLQFAFTRLGNEIFRREERIRDYERALHIADEDQVKLPEIPLLVARR